MSAPLKSHNQAGFSMIEVMVTGAILAIAILGLTLQMTAQKNAKGSVDTANTGRRVMIRLIETVIGQPYRFPYFQKAGKGIVYVGCFDQNGGPIVTDATAPIGGVKDYIGVWSIDPTVVAQFAVALTGANLVCPQNDATSALYNQGGFEVHVAPNPFPADNLGSKVSVVSIPLGVTASMVQQSSSPALSMSIRLGGLPNIPTNQFSATAVSTGQWCPPVAGACGAAAATACGMPTACDSQIPGALYCFCY